MMEKAYLNILNNFDKLDQHFPDFVPMFQSRILPLVLQSSNYNKELVRTAPAAFPPKIDASEADFVTKTVPIKVDYKSISQEEFEACAATGSDKCTRAGLKFPNKQYISTKLYAVPGTIVTATFPTECLHKIDVSFCNHY